MKDKVGEYAVATADAILSLFKENESEDSDSPYSLSEIDEKKW